MSNNNLSEWVLAHKRVTITLLSVLFFSVIFVRFYFFHGTTNTGGIDWLPLVEQTLDGLISAIIVTFVVSIALWWTKSPLDRIPPGYEIRPKEITDKLEKAAADSDEWEYVGHTARYTRNKIFQSLLEQSKKANRSIRVRIVILNPCNDIVCQSYADHRNSSRSSEMFQKDWNINVVKVELFATIIKSLRLNLGSSKVSCEIRFRDFLSQYRFDVSHDQVMVTQEDPQEPAYQYPRGSRFFEYCKRENQLVWDQASPRDLSTERSVDLFDKNSVIELLSNLFHDCEGVDTLSSEAFELLKNDISPYA